MCHDGPDSPYVQDVLSLGLEKLHQVATVQSFEERCQLLPPRQLPHDHPRHMTQLFYFQLGWANMENDDINLEDFAPEDEASLIRQPFFLDPDTGAADVWRWAHQKRTLANFIYHQDRSVLRSWAYVLWDRARLDAVGVFQKPWEGLDGAEE